jgi:hypothetical protein
MTPYIYNVYKPGPDDTGDNPDVERPDETGE